MKVENEKIFIRKIKSSYLATYNGVKGKAKTMYGAIEKAQKNYLELKGKSNDLIDILEYGILSELEKRLNNDTTRSID